MKVRLVLRVFCRCAFMRPFVVAMRSGGCFRICLVVMVGKVVRYPFVMALHHVSRFGLNMAACAKRILSAIAGC